MGTVTPKLGKVACEVTIPQLVLGDSHVKEAPEVATSHWPDHFLKLIIFQLNK